MRSRAREVLTPKGPSVPLLKVNGTLLLAGTQPCQGPTGMPADATDARSGAIREEKTRAGYAAAYVHQRV